MASTSGLKSAPRPSASTAMVYALILSPLPTSVVSTTKLRNRASRIELRNTVLAKIRASWSRTSSICGESGAMEESSIRTTEFKSHLDSNSADVPITRYWKLANRYFVTLEFVTSLVLTSSFLTGAIVTDGSRRRGARDGGDIGAQRCRKNAI